MIFFWLFLMLIYGGFLAAVLSLAVLALVYVLGPALFYLGYKRPLEPSFVPIEDFPPAFAKEMEGRVRALQVLGLSEQARLSFPSRAHNEPAYFSMLTDAETGDKALVVAIVPRGSLTPRAVYVELSRRLASGDLRTMNSLELHASHRDSSGSSTTWLPQVRDVAALVAMHRHICHKLAPSERGELYQAGEAGAFLEREMREENAILARDGVLCADEDAGVWRPTWRGACLLTWKNLWPQAGARRARAKSLATERLYGGSFVNPSKN